MGEQDVSQPSDAAELRRFTQHLLTDLRAFQQMLDDDMFETGVSRIGAEQELFLVDRYWRPARNNMEVLEEIGDPRCTTELGRFNIEFNLNPIEFSTGCLRQLENDLNSMLAVVREAAARLETQVVQIGILPTLEKRDLTLANMTPRQRYAALNREMTRLRGTSYELRIKGRDELRITHDNVMLEACNTSFQVHFQVSPADFARRYNIAQAVAAPTLAAATNSPLLFGRQLWRETRIALFQQSIDTRPATPYLTEQQPRVSFGRSWVESSPVEIFREDITRFRVLMSREIDEDPLALLAEGKAPRLLALTLHNGTVYRWNRPCYGITAGRPHVRIENRVLPSGPTVLDEVANAAFWFGMMTGMDREYPDITEVMDFEDARENLVAAARRGLGSHMAWPERGHVSSQRLILGELLPLARRGLASVAIDEADIERYLGTIEARVESQFTGSQWQVDSLAAMKSRTTEAERLAAVVAGAVTRQIEGKPVHTWKPASIEEAGDLKSQYQRVGQLMTTDVFTVSQDEVVDMVACVMNWKHIRHVPVEDGQRHLVGMVTHRALLRLLTESPDGRDQPAPVSSIMTRDLITAHPETPTVEALRTMRENRISAMPVVDHDGYLVGIVTERDFMGIATQLLEGYLRDA
jgi:CBS domain-containing protein/gamma-glutamylcysteine synthetase